MGDVQENAEWRLHKERSVSTSTDWKVHLHRHDPPLNSLSPPLLPSQGADIIVEAQTSETAHNDKWDDLEGVNQDAFDWWESRGTNSKTAVYEAALDLGNLLDSAGLC